MFETDYSRRAFLRDAAAGLSAGVLTAGEAPGMGSTPRTRPHILITAGPVPGLTSVEDLRAATRSGHPAELWAELRRKAEADLGADPWLPGTRLPGRSAAQAKHENPDYVIVTRTADRVLRAALVCLLTGDLRYRDAALRQMEALFDERLWPDWRDRAHRNRHADLRNGTFVRELSLAYDWLYPVLSAADGRAIVDGIDRRGIQPIFRDVAAGTGYTTRANRSNWMTNIIGGLGVAGMCLEGDHPRSEEMVALGLDRMTDYLQIYGPLGEFNESPAYANANEYPVDFFTAYRYYTRGRSNPLAGHPFPATARWVMYATVPPGHVMAFGDSSAGTPPRAAYVAAIAAAADDPFLQWFYLNLARDGDGATPRQLLRFDPSLAPESPQGKLPLGAAFPAEGAIFVSRTSWDFDETACVVYGKAAREHNHDHDDSGHVSIDGYGQPLLIDTARPSNYPADFFGPNRRSYYNASARGHNVLTFADAEMLREGEGRILEADFEDDRGGYVVLDLTGAYPEVVSVRRVVVHLHPGIVAVLDEAVLPSPAEIALRWHTATRPELDSGGRFRVTNGPARLTARVVALEGPRPRWEVRKHEYQPPFHLDRLGEPLEQRYEPFVLATATADRARFLSLFAVSRAGEPVGAWEAAAGRLWRIEAAGTEYLVDLREGSLLVGPRRGEPRWEVDLG